MNHKKTVDYTHFQEPRFRLEDLSINDFKNEQYYTPKRNIEPERLTQIYQQAFIYDLLFKFAKEHLPDVHEVKKGTSNKITDNNGLEKNQSTDTTIDKIKEKVLEYLFKEDVSNESTSGNKQERLGLTDNETSSDNIWNTDDLNILRKNFDGIKENNIRLRGKVAAFEEENKTLKEKLAKIELQTGNGHNEKLALEQENERLYIRVQDLESRYRIFYDEMAENDRDKQSATEAIQSLQSENHNLKAQQSKMEFEMNKLEQKFATLRTEQRLYFNSLMDGIKLKYQNRIRSLQDKLAESDKRCSEERLASERTKRALEHLRTHFMLSASQFENEDKIDDTQIR